VLLASLVGASLLGASPLRAQTPPDCTGANEPEEYGPTDVNATSGNQSLSAGFNEKATITVLKWPSPSFYDQVKYRTAGRDEARLGALPNEGAFLGVAWRTGSGAKWKFEWLRQWPSTQRWADDDGDVVVTRFRRAALGLRVTVTDVVAHDRDVLLRQVAVTRTRTSRVQTVRVVGFANFNPVFSKTQQAPHDDWCTEEDNDDGASYEKAADAVVHARSGTDASTGAPSGAALAMGFFGRSEGHQVGADTYQAASGTSAYDDARDGKLRGDATAEGQADTALLDQLSLARNRSAATTLAIAAAFTPEEALSLLEGARERSASAVIAAKGRWWRSWLSGARLPRDAPPPVVKVAKRSLIVMRQAVDPAPRDGAEGGLVVASITTQPPLGLDWIRHGAYVNRALHAAGHPETVRAHNIRYGQLQVTATNRPRGASGTTPAGNWAQNYYADGVVGGPIPYEIDETGLGMWTLYDHYDLTDERSYLTRREIYESIQRSAQYLTDVCRDVTSGLQCLASERDNPAASQTLVGAEAVWLGLDAAVDAATALGTVDSKSNAERWATRRDELGAAIRDRFFDESCTCYTTDPDVGGTLLWPVRFLRYGSEESDAQAEVNFRYVSRSMRGRNEQGGQEVKALLGNAYAWGGSERDLRRVRSGLSWVARVTASTTNVLGEAWITRRGRIIPISGQPHVPTHAQFYLAALKAFGSKPYSFE
jgi:hypothetical protein